MKYLSIIALLTLSSACTTDMARRTTYETLENVRMQRCAGNIMADCPERESYNEYQRKRDEVVK